MSEDELERHQVALLKVRMVLGLDRDSQSDLVEEILRIKREAEECATVASGLLAALERLQHEAAANLRNREMFMVNPPINAAVEHLLKLIGKALEDARR